jgi:hypothetical protein
MPASPTLLTYRNGQRGDFTDWLENLGLKDFIATHSINKLIEWGWITPQYRVIFPTDFFEKWENFPELPWKRKDAIDTAPYALFWEYS